MNNLFLLLVSIFFSLILRRRWSKGNNLDIIYSYWKGDTPSMIMWMSFLPLFFSIALCGGIEVFSLEEHVSIIAVMFFTAGTMFSTISIVFNPLLKRS